ncbi:hypothetical protein ACOME3_010492 [Neoechinorhynchus agilis]
MAGRSLVECINALEIDNEALITNNSDDSAFINANRTGIVFAIDGVQSSSNHIALSFDACSTCVQSIIHDDDLVAVLIFGTIDERLKRIARLWHQADDIGDILMSNDLVDGVRIVCDLQQPSADIVLKLERCAKLVEVENFDQAIAKCPLNEVLWESTRSMWINLSFNLLVLTGSFFANINN